MRKLPRTVFALALLCASQASPGWSQGSGAKPETYPATYYFYCAGMALVGQTTPTMYYSSVFSRVIDSRLSLVNSNFNGPFTIYLTKTFGVSAHVGCPAWPSMDGAVNDQKTAKARGKAKIVETNWAP